MSVIDGSLLLQSPQPRNIAQRSKREEKAVAVGGDVDEATAGDPLKLSG